MNSIQQLGNRLSNRHLILGLTIWWLVMLLVYSLFTLRVNRLKSNLIQSGVELTREFSDHVSLPLLEKNSQTISKLLTDAANRSDVIYASVVDHRNKVVAFTGTGHLMPDMTETARLVDKVSTWEGGFRVPCVIRWPGVIKAGTIFNDIHSHEDMMPTLLAAAGVPDVKQKLLEGYQAGDKNFKVHLDGYNMMPFWKGEVDESPRKEIFYFDQGGNLNAVRYNNWKLHFTYMEGSINEAFRKTTGS